MWPENLHGRLIQGLTVTGLRSQTGFEESAFMLSEDKSSTKHHKNSWKSSFKRP